ncbi:SIR2 family protein [Alicyclobacillus macrosporangiidus]|uniref:SIR2 family protein n=1 Tax=Alicyclobacillus macrosporangiidus TaxID=392015 RepID=UPI0009DE8718|nr:SIR2 family protein [Alicyclobacillus macrosporangiidus]
MINFPESLIHEIAERRCIIVLGAGASAGCVGVNNTKPPTWDDFLTQAAELVRDSSDKDEALKLISSGQYLDAAQVIVDSADEGDFAYFIRRIFETPRYQPSEIHHRVLLLDPKIVVTTNYDQVYERLCQNGSARDGYNVCKYYETHALNDIRSTTRVILKAHGCVSDPSQIVLTRAQYFRARNQFTFFFNILDALFLTHTLLFIGSRMTDPDILLLLENANIAAPTQRRHYAIVESGRHPSVRKAMRETYNLELLEYDMGQHDQVVAALDDLITEVQAYRATHS